MFHELGLKMPQHYYNNFLWSTYSEFFMLFGYLIHNIWYQSKMVLGFGCLKLVILEFSL
jgi:hypothetical protein